MSRPLSPLALLSTHTQQFTLKFTRGDIIVDLSKLKFFQKQLTRSLITGENPDRASLRQQIIEPIQAELERINKGLQEHEQGNVSARETHLHELYDSIVPLKGKAPRSDDYVLQVLKAWKGPVDDPFHFLQDNIFAFFRPSRAAMCKRFDELQSNMARIMLLLSDRKTLENVDISRVLKRFTYKLGAVKEADWTAENLGDIVKKLTDSVKFYDTGDGQDKFESAGWAFMRHALINGKAGSAIVPLMLLFGQRETVGRIRVARKVAEVEERKLLRKTERARKGGRKPVHTIKATPLSDRHEIEARIVETAKPPDKGTGLRLPLGEAPFKIYQQKEKGRGEPLQEGQFKSRPPTPPPPKSPPRDPSEVQRSSQFLSFSEFKLGIRHINLKEEPEDHSPAFGDIEELQRQQEAQHRKLQIPEQVKIDAAVNKSEGKWAVPKPRTPRSQNGQPTAQEVGPLEDQVASEADGPLNVDSAPGRTDNGTTMGHMPLKVNDRGMEPGPFKFQVGNALPIDREKHVQHLRALNRMLAFKRSVGKKVRSRNRILIGPARLEQLKATGLGPMVEESMVKDTPRGRAAGDTGGVSQHSYDDNEQATALPPKHNGPALVNESDRHGEVWGTNKGLDYHGRRQAAAESNIKKKVEEEEKASLARLETQMAKQWVKRDE